MQDAAHELPITRILGASVNRGKGGAEPLPREKDPDPPKEATRGSGAGLDLFQGLPQRPEVTLLRVGHRVDGSYCRFAQRPPEFAPELRAPRVDIDHHAGKV